MAIREPWPEGATLRASSAPAAREDVHEHDQGIEDHRCDGDDGDRGHVEDSRSVPSCDSFMKTPE
jgi:hypothetical protein